MKLPPDESPELATLTALGFGPNQALMTGPRLFLDARLLGALVVELEDELGYPQAARTLFRIGLVHGLRDADRVIARGLLADPDAAPRIAAGSTDAVLADDFRFTPLRIELAPASAPAALPRAGIALRGHWPERHEAAAWLSKLGPSDDATCWLSCGYTSGWLSGAFDADLIALEERCSGRGEAHCEFTVREPAAWQREAPGWLDERLGAIDFDVYRALALRRPQGPAPELVESQGDFDRDAPLVHIWGPVMVIPFTSADELMRTTEALSSDPGIAEIGAVVLDLRDHAIDEGFEAAALERVLETVETWAAEPILTGVAPFAEPVVAGLETRHLLVRKDLSEAIAAAFLIAQAQRHVV